MNLSPPSSMPGLSSSLLATLETFSGTILTPMAVKGSSLRLRELVAAAAGIDEGERRHVGFAAAEIGRGANDRLDVLGGHHDARVLLDRPGREVAHLDRDLAVDLGAVELVVGRGRRGRRAVGAVLSTGGSGAEVSAKMRSASYSGIWSACSGEGGDSVATTRAKGRSLMKSRSPCLVTVETWRIWRLDTASSVGRMRSPLRPKARPPAGSALARLDANRARRRTGWGC